MHIKYILIPFIFLFAVSSASASIADIQANFSYYREINIVNPNLIDYVSVPINVTIDTQALIGNGTIQADCDDIRIYDNSSNKVNEYNRTACNTADTTFQFKVNMSASQDMDYYILYGNTDMAKDINLTTWDNSYYTYTNYLSSLADVNALGDWYVSYLVPISFTCYRGYDTNTTLAFPDGCFKIYCSRVTTGGDYMATLLGAVKDRIAVNNTGIHQKMIIGGVATSSWADSVRVIWNGITATEVNVASDGDVGKNTTFYSEFWFNSTGGAMSNQTATTSGTSTNRTLGQALYVQNGATWILTDYLKIFTHPDTYSTVTLGAEQEPSVVTVILNSPSNTTYYDSNQIYNFTLMGGFTGATCYFNGTSIGNIVNGTTYQADIYGNFGSNFVNITCINTTTVGTATRWFKINDFLNNLIVHTTTAFEITNNTFGIGFQYNTDLLYNNLTCWMDYNNTARVVQLSNSANATAGYVTPLTIANNTANNVNYNCTIAYKNGTTVYYNYTGTPQNLIWAYNITSLTSSKNPAMVGDTVTYTINGFEWASLANTNYYLQWNKTDYTGLTTVSGAVHSTAMLMPVVNGYNASAVVVGVLNVTYGGLRRNMTAPFIIQTIVKPSIVNCTLFPSDDVTLFTLTWYNETDKSLMIGGEANVEIELINPDGNSSTFNFGIHQHNVTVYNFTSYDLCLYPAFATGTYNLLASYDAYNYNTREYIIEDEPINNASTTILKLFNLPATGLYHSNYFSFNLKDHDDSNINGAIFQFLRYYLDDGTDEYVAMGKTDELGNGYTYLEYDTAYYKILVMKDGEIIYTVGAKKIDPLAVLPANYKVIAGAGIEYFEYKDVNYIYNFNTSDWLTFTIVDTSSTSLAGGSLTVDNLTISGWNNVCSRQTTGVNSVTMYCFVGNRTEQVIKVTAYVISSGSSYLIFNQIFDERTLATAMGEEGLLLGTLLIIFFGCVGITFGPAGLVMMLMVGLMVTSSFNLIRLDAYILIIIEPMLGVILVLLLKRD